MASLADGIARAILTLLETEKTVAEGAGAVALVAILEGKVKLAGKWTARKYFSPSKRAGANTPNN